MVKPLFKKEIDFEEEKNMSIQALKYHGLDKIYEIYEMQNLESVAPHAVLPPS